MTAAHFSEWVTFDEEPGVPEWEKVSSSDANQCRANIANGIVNSAFDSHCLEGESEIRSYVTDSLNEPLNSETTSSPECTTISEYESELYTPLHPTNPFLTNLPEPAQTSPVNPFHSYCEHLEDVISKPSGEGDWGNNLYSSSVTCFPTNEVDETKRSSGFSDGTSSQISSVESGHQEECAVKLKQSHAVDSHSLNNLPCSSAVVSSLCVHCPDYVAQSEGWHLMLRIPERKSKMSSRQWGPIYLTLKDGLMQFYYEKGLEKPFKKFTLQIGHELSEFRLEHFNELGKIHTLRIEAVAYKEKRKFQAKPTLLFADNRSELLKLGTTDYGDFTSFVQSVQDELMKLPCPVETNVAYMEDMMLVEVSDEFQGILNVENDLVQHAVTTHIQTVAFISGNHDCCLNFHNCDTNSTETAFTEIDSMAFYGYQFHSCTKIVEFNASKMVKFTPPDACKIELLRFRTIFPEKGLPFLIKTIATVQGAFIELQSWLVMSTEFSSNQSPHLLVPCENVMVRYPIPADWVKIFRTENLIKQKSLTAKVNKSAKFGSVSCTGLEPLMQVTIGSAKYEHAFNAIVWRIEKLPDRNVAADHPHRFSCRLELGSNKELPCAFFRSVDVEFDMPAAMASRTLVGCVSSPANPNLGRCVTYKSHFHCKVEMERRWLHLGDTDVEERPAACALQ
uniref:Stonin-2-like n=1 Tax=Petromyzon marinus TaxID=7757 RepID=A0AAJ7WN66_PETMA|nr:stonin-2-like [Petromyzon marinus]XP_032803932.1 stonin-2-like [Petromyzon marinus]